MWRSSDRQGNECAKIRWELVPYTRGQGLDLGSGPSKPFAHMVAVDNCKDTALFNIQMQPDVRCDVTAMPMFASASQDFVFSSHTLEHIEDHVAALREWWRVLKVGGFLCLYLPHKDHYPQCAGREAWNEWIAAHKDEYHDLGPAIEAYVQPRRAAGEKRLGYLYAGTPYANEDHKRDFAPEDVIAAMKQVGSWDLVENQERSGGNEYSMFLVFKKLPDEDFPVLSFKESAVTA